MSTLDTESLDGKSDDNDVSNPVLELRPGSAGEISQSASVDHNLDSPQGGTADSSQTAASCTEPPIVPSIDDASDQPLEPTCNLSFHRVPGTDTPAVQIKLEVTIPLRASQVTQAESLFHLFKHKYPVIWRGLLALKSDEVTIQMHFVHGNVQLARESLPQNLHGTSPPLRIIQRMRLEPPQLEGVAKKMQIKEEHCMLVALPCGKDWIDVVHQSNILQCGFVTYLQKKQGAGIVSIAGQDPQQAAYIVHIFPACEFANKNFTRLAPDLLHRVAEMAHLLIVITAV